MTNEQIMWQQTIDWHHRRFQGPATLGNCSGSGPNSFGKKKKKVKIKRKFIWPKWLGCSSFSKLSITVDNQFRTTHWRSTYLNFFSVWFFEFKKFYLIIWSSSVKLNWLFQNLSINLVNLVKHEKLWDVRLNELLSRQLNLTSLV